MRCKTHSLDALPCRHPRGRQGQDTINHSVYSRAGRDDVAEDRNDLRNSQDVLDPAWWTSSEQKILYVNLHDRNLSQWISDELDGKSGFE